jgi:DNA-binding transcriptional LysR family regulator
VNAAPRGTLRVTCPSFVGNSTRVANMLAAYARRYPDVVVDGSFEDRLVDVVAEGYDLAIRCTSEPPPGGLIARRLRSMPFVIAASPEYLRRKGVPRSVEELADHDCVMVGNENVWELSTPDGTVKVPARVILRLSSTPAVAHAVAAGVGLAPLPIVLLEEPTFKGRILPLLTERPLRQVDMYALYASRRYVPPKIRTFVDHMIEYFAAVPLPTVARQLSAVPASPTGMVQGLVARG